MPNTTNFNWTTPADTDLVKDGALAIRTLANGIDTSLLDLKGGTTGQVLSKATNTDLDFTWVTQDDTNAIQNAIIDAKGDLIVGTAADTPARLAVGGTNGHVLTVDSTETSGIKWAAVAAGGKTLLSTTTLSGSSVTISSINQNYTDLHIYIEGAYNSTDGEFNLRINGITSSSYSWGTVYQASGSASAESANAVAQIRLNRIGADIDWNRQNTTIIEVYRYAETTPFTKIFHSGRTFNGGYYWTHTGVGTQSDAGALTSITLFPQSGTFSGGTVYIYGVK